MAIQTISYSSNRQSIKLISFQFSGKNIVGDDIKGLTEVWVDNSMYITERPIMPLLSKLNCAGPTNFICKASFLRYRLKGHDDK